MSGWPSDAWICLAIAAACLGGGALVLRFHPLLDRSTERKRRAWYDKVAAGKASGTFPYDARPVAVSSRTAGFLLGGLGLLFLCFFVVEVR
jgi:hypothetical protein